MNTTQTLVSELAEIWQEKGVWLELGIPDALDQIFNKAAATYANFLRFEGPPLENTDEGMADVMILILHYFNQRGLDADKVIRERLSRLNIDRQVIDD